MAPAVPEPTLRIAVLRELLRVADAAEHHRLLSIADVPDAWRAHHAEVFARYAHVYDVLRAVLEDTAPYGPGRPGPGATPSASSTNAAT